jgi:hypothetical protein
MEIRFIAYGPRRNLSRGEASRKATLPDPRSDVEAPTESWRVGARAKKIKGGYATPQPNRTFAHPSCAINFIPVALLCQYGTFCRGCFENLCCFHEKTNGIGFALWSCLFVQWHSGRQFGEI